MKIIARDLQFPEGPVWLADGTLVFVEIGRQTLSRVDAAGKVSVVAHIPGGPNGAALGPGGLIYICNNGGVEFIRKDGTCFPVRMSDDYISGSISTVDPETGRVDVLYDRCGEHLLRGPNDLVFDASGDFWFTDYGKRTGRVADRSFVYWAKADGSEIREVIGPITTANGIGLSPDGKTLYVAETEPGRLWAYEITGPGEVRKAPWPSLTGGRIIASSPGGFVRFDSLAVSASGNVCCAGLERASIVDINPATGGYRYVAVPDMYVTNLCFGGPELRTAFATLSHSGQIAAFEWHEPGLKLNF